MEGMICYILPVGVSILLLTLLRRGVQLAWKWLIHSLCGFLCLWLCNSISGITGIAIPINAVTVAVTGIFGLPGMALLAYF